MRENGGGMPRDPNDVQCGREVDAHFLSQLHSARRQIQNQSARLEVDRVITILSSIPHLRFHDLPRFQLDHININLSHRKAFVSNALSLRKFKQAIRRNHLRVLKFNAIHDLLQAVIQAATDIAFRFQAHIISGNVVPRTPPSEPLSNFVLEFHSLIQYANSQLIINYNTFPSSTLKRSFFRNDFKLL